MADCGTNDWRFYENRKAYVSGLVDHAGKHIAVWESSQDKRLYTHGANMKLVSRPFDEFKNDYGAEWIKKSASVRSVNMHRLKESESEFINKSASVRRIDMHRLKEFKKSASVRRINRLKSLIHRIFSGI